MRTFPVADPGDPDIRSAGRYLTWLAVRSRRTILMGILWASVWMVAQALMPAAVGRAIDAIEARDEQGLLAWSGALLGIAVLIGFTGTMRHRNAVANFLDGAFRTIQLVTRHASRLGAALQRRIASGEVVGVGTSDVDAIGSTLDITARGCASIVTLAVVAVVLLNMSVPLGLLVLIGVPLLMGLVSLLLRPLHRRQNAYRDLQTGLADRAVDIASGLRVLRGIGGERTFGARYRRESQQLRVAGVRTARVESLLEAAQFLVPGFFVAFGSWLAARFALDGRLTVGQMVSFYGYAAFLTVPLSTLTEFADRVVRGLVAARRVTRVLALEPGVTDSAEPVAWPPPGDLVDRSSGLLVRPGVLLGIACEDPQDAPALADRLGRYEEADVLYADVPLADLALADVRTRILVGHHDAGLFAGPLRRELTPGDGGTGDLATAVEVACADDVIDALDQGLDTEIAARGREFSGGQVQRLRLVRLLLAEPQTLVLIEPTSAVDAHTEARIAARLAAHRRGSTTVVATTSPLVLDTMDEVAYVEDGKVMAVGSHRELLATEPRYAALVTRVDEDARDAQDAWGAQGDEGDEGEESA
ncbi:ABC transporter transmembrane domain-containing protein [Embleya scabrispora]|uniref:ABC transporter transmembrane domain-containing protein n=1 Tax=Embleya scabrispora TaxID=159449 RepID=UPI00037F82BD|nr:ABC transporter ATP-binding protein [Embleya scabrispora]MYS84653.1 ABC transporter ATP-binding protein [Streptomyces sp. SID5474]